MTHPPRPAWNVRTDDDVVNPEVVPLLPLEEGGVVHPLVGVGVGQGLEQQGHVVGRPALHTLQIFFFVKTTQLLCYKIAGKSRGLSQAFNTDRNSNVLESSDSLSFEAKILEFLGEKWEFWENFTTFYLIKVPRH